MIGLIICALLLSFFGIFTVFGIQSNLLPIQLMHVGLGLVGFFLMKKIGRTFFRSNYKVWYWLFVGILLITFFIGLEVKGSKRWIDLVFFNFQPSEFFKVFFILFFAQLFSQRRAIENKLSFYLKSVGYFLLPTLIIFKQPDLGNALVYTFIFLTLTLFSHVPKKYIVTSFLIILCVMPLGWFFLKDYQKARIFSFLNPHLDTRGTSYNMIQSVITVGSGKFSGRGLGFGTQSKLAFLPENHTDFAFSSLVEQFGFIGGFAVIVLFAVLIYILVGKAAKYYLQRTEGSTEHFLFTVGFLSYFAFHIFVNIGMNVGLFPIAGITLPFISYGGSSTVAIFLGFALLP